jgi:hypothetical protein
MQIWKDKTVSEILQSMEAEIAKAKNELSCAEGDIQKAKGRITFIISAIHNLNSRDIEE